MDQLVKIYQVVGPLDRKLLKYMETMFGASAYKLMANKHKQMTSYEICRKKLRERYKKKISNVALDLLTRLLDNNSETRPTARQALQHEWFSDLVDKDPQLRAKLRNSFRKNEQINVEKILEELNNNCENKAQNLKESEKKEKIFRFSDMEKFKKLKNIKKEKTYFHGPVRDEKRSFFGQQEQKGNHIGTKVHNMQPNKENLENKSRALINEKIRKKNFSVTKNKPLKSKGLKMGFSMIPKLSEHSNRSKDSKQGNMKSFINTAFQLEKRRMQGASMGKSKNKKPFLKKKSKTTQLKSKVYQNTFSCLGYKINHKLGNIQKHLKQKRLQEGEKTRPVNDRKKRRKDSKCNQMTGTRTGCFL